MALLGLLTLLSCVVISRATIQASISFIQPSGLRISINDQPGVSLAAVHFSVNADLFGVAPGQTNEDITSKTSGQWVYENAHLQLNPGDLVNYWLYIVQNGIGENLLGQSWTVPSAGSRTTRPVGGRSSITGTSPPLATPMLVQSGKATGSSGTSCTSYPCVVFRDDFNSLDLATWQHEITASGGGNWEFEYYTNNRSNSYVRDGVLFIKPTLTSEKFGEAFLSTGTLSLWGGCTNNAFYGCERAGSNEHYINPIQSARLRSKSTFSFRYGRVEVEAKMPTGDWIWPAIWMLPTDNAYGDWPASGEIDLVESRGNTDLKDSQGKSIGVDSMGSTLHYGPYYPQNGWRKAHVEKIASSGTFGTSFHKYVVEWDENSIRFYLDNTLIRTVDPGSAGFWGLGQFNNLQNTDNPWTGRGKMAPFDQKFHIIMNVAVGGTGGFFPDGIQNGGYPKPWNDKSPTASRDFWRAKNHWYPTWKANVNNGENAAMQVRYIQVSKLKAD